LFRALAGVAGGVGVGDDDDGGSARFGADDEDGGDGAEAVLRLGLLTALAAVGGEAVLTLLLLLLLLLLLVLSPLSLVRAAGARGVLALLLSPWRSLDRRSDLGFAATGSCCSDDARSGSSRVR
jgi:hypothetical protein